MTAVDLATRIADELSQRYGCHTVLLYGSRARGDATVESDWDVVGVRAEGPTVWDARSFEGGWLDAFVYPETAMAVMDEGTLRLRGCVVLRDEQGFAGPLLAGLEVFYEKGPAPMAATDRVATVAWLRKTQARIRRGDAEGNYRRARLLVIALENWFHLRGRWYAGPRASLAWLREHRREVFAVFDTALAPGADLPAIERLVDCVVHGVAET